MNRTFRISREHIIELSVLKDVSAKQLLAAADYVQSLKTPAISFVAVQNALAKHLDKDLASTLTRHLLGLAILQRQRKYSAEDVAISVIKSVRGVESEERDDHWNTIKSAIVELLSSQSVAVASKASELESDHQNIYIKSKIITEIRPVFDAKRTEISGSVVFSTFKFDYFDGTESKSINVAVDVNDIKELRDFCTQALLKISYTKELMVTRLGLPAIVMGEEEEDGSL